MTFIFTFVATEEMTNAYPYKQKQGENIAKFNDW